MPFSEISTVHPVPASGFSVWPIRMFRISVIGISMPSSPYGRAFPAVPPKPSMIRTASSQVLTRIMPCASAS